MLLILRLPRPSGKLRLAHFLTASLSPSAVGRRCPHRAAPRIGAALWNLPTPHPGALGTASPYPRRFLSCLYADCTVLNPNGILPPPAMPGFSIFRTLFQIADTPVGQLAKFAHKMPPTVHKMALEVHKMATALDLGAVACPILVMAVHLIAMTGHLTALTVPVDAAGCAADGLG